MSAEGDIRYSQELFLLALKGPVTVHFVDGRTLEGEFTTQDAWNVFLMVDDEPTMIPRSQILYIKGTAGQQIEQDTSQQAFLTREEATLAPLPLEAGRVGDGGRTETAFVVEPETQDSLSPEPLSTAVRDGDRTDVKSGPEPVVQEADEEEPDMTFVLPSTADLSAELEKMAEPEPEMDDLTLVLDEAEDEDEITYVFEEAEPAVSGRLTCTSGPYAGEQFDLRGEVITIGRSRDNDIPLSLDKEISRRHALIKLESGKFVIYDQNSLNGTYVNNERIDAPRILQDGDAVLVGVTDMKYEVS
jgi:sRNA-binding regulator protein Hfq